MVNPSNIPTKRIMSLDALRGFDMIWILGGDEIIYTLHRTNHSRLVNFLYTQMNHRIWEGLTFYDLIFPLFVFIVGASLVFSLDKRMITGGRVEAIKKIVLRSAVLYLLGIIYYGGFSHGLKDIRLLGVLQRIALCYLVCGLMYLYLNTRWRIAACFVLLAGYWALMTYVPVPSVGAGNYSEGRNLANFIDSRYLPYFKWDGDHDPEGLLSTLPAIATCLLGVFAGQFLKSENPPAQKKVFWFAVVGLAGIALGKIWGLQFPVIKKVWTSSYVLLTGGLSFLLLAFFYQIIDVWHLATWARPFIWVGLNPITLYLLQNIIDFRDLASRLAGGVIQAQIKIPGNLWLSVVVVLLVFLFAYFLHRKRIYVRI